MCSGHAETLLASDRARIGMFFVRMGLVPELASSQFLVQRVGFALASEMCLSGRLYEAGELEDVEPVERPERSEGFREGIW